MCVNKSYYTIDQTGAAVAAIGGSFQLMYCDSLYSYHIGYKKKYYGDLWLRVR